MAGPFLFSVRERCLTLTMIKKLLVPVLLLSFFSCSPGDKKPATTDTDVATAFIRSILDNDFRSAEQYLLKDEMNQQYFERFEQQYHSKDKAELEKYKASDILINKIDATNDSTRIVDYSNTYKKDVKTKLKLVWVNGKWLVDLKFTSAENQ
jgi:hypothetical protein